MNQRVMRCLLCLLAITLAAAPLRGVLALTLQPDSGDVSHCAMMQSGMPADADPAAAPVSPSGKHCPGCVQDCPADLCAAHCALFLHAFVALADDVTPVRVAPGLVPAVAHADALPDCTVPPLYRPPIPF